MSASTRQNAILNWSGNLAFALTVIASYVPLFLPIPPSFDSSRFVGLIVLGAAYLLIGTLAFEFFCRVESPLSVIVYFAIQIPLATTIIYLGRGDGLIGLLVLPLASHAVIMVARRWLPLVIAFLVIAEIVPYGLLGGPTVLFQAGIGYFAGIIFVVVFTLIAENERLARGEVERLAAQLSAANDKLREYAAQAEELATIKERNRLAREIHDTLGHYLTTLNMQLEAAQAVIESDRPRALDALQKAQTLTKDGLADVRRSVAALRDSPMQGRTLREAIAALANECREAGIVTEFSALGDPRALAPQTELALYRVAQEGLTNVQRHSHASRAAITLDYRGAQTVRLQLQDNGVGAKEPDGGFGLLGLRERVQLLDGTLETCDAPGGGFVLQVELPG